jgi:hypothetical protein
MGLTGNAAVGHKHIKAAIKIPHHLIDDTFDILRLSDIDPVRLT